MRTLVLLAVTLTVSGAPLAARVYTFIQNRVASGIGFMHRRIITCGRFADSRRMGWLSTFRRGTNPRQLRNS